jgi:hypothetical protein
VAKGLSRLSKFLSCHSGASTGLVHRRRAFAKHPRSRRHSIAASLPPDMVGLGSARFEEIVFIQKIARLLVSNTNTTRPDYMKPTSENCGKPLQYKTQPANKSRAIKQAMKKKASRGHCASLLHPQIMANKTIRKQKGRLRGTVCPSMKVQKLKNPKAIPASIVAHQVVTKPAGYRHSWKISYAAKPSMPMCII